MARPVGTTNKLKPSIIDDILKERGFNLVHKAVDLYHECGDSKVMASILRMLMEYQYSKRRPVDENGNAETINIIQPKTPEEMKEILDLARGQSKA
jgi:hypothetical protein